MFFWPASSKVECGMHHAATRRIEQFFLLIFPSTSISHLTFNRPVWDAKSIYHGEQYGARCTIEPRGDKAINTELRRDSKMY